jgi:hypothetical protein
MANKKTGKKKEENKDDTPSAVKNSSGKKKTSSAKKTAGKKTTSSSTKKSSKTAKATKKTTGKKKTSSTKKSETGPAKINVRVTQENISGIEEGMEEAHYKKGGKESAVSSQDKEKKKQGKKASIAGKKEENSKSGKNLSAESKLKKKSSSSKTGVATKEKQAENKAENKDLWTSFAVGGDDDKKEKKTKRSKPRSISLYKKIAFTFIILTFLLLATVFYFSAVSLEITLTPAKERINDKLILEVYDKNSKAISLSGKSLSGIVDQLTINRTGTYKSTGEEIIGEEIVGKVTIINNYSQNQPLVATTRLLSPRDKLYRLSNTVTVPAGGSVEADIYTDNPSPEDAIGPTRFTIPGLWAGLQDDIYAESKEGFKYETEKRKFIKKEDINNAIMDIKQELSQKAEQEFGDNYLGYDEVIYDLASVDTKIEKETGEEAEEFEVVAEGTINVVAFDNEKLKKIVESKLYSSLPKNRKLVEFNEEEVDYFLNNYNFSDKKATLEVSFSGKTVFKDIDQILNKKNIVGLSRQQLNDYLGELDEVSDYKIDFFPSFVDTAPSLVDKIKIKIED